MDQLRHQIHHLLLGAAVFVAGVLFDKTHTYHHREEQWQNLSNARASTNARSRSKSGKSRKPNRKRGRG